MAAPRGHAPGAKAANQKAGGNRVDSEAKVAEHKEANMSPAWRPSRAGGAKIIEQEHDAAIVVVVVVWNWRLKTANGRRGGAKAPLSKLLHRWTAAWTLALVQCVCGTVCGAQWTARRLQSALHLGTALHSSSLQAQWRLPLGKRRAKASAGKAEAGRLEWPRRRQVGANLSGQVAKSIEFRLSRGEQVGAEKTENKGDRCCTETGAERPAPVGQCSALLLCKMPPEEPAEEPLGDKRDSVSAARMCTRVGEARRKEGNSGTERETVMSQLPANSRVAASRESFRRHLRCGAI